MGKYARGEENGEGRGGGGQETTARFSPGTCGSEDEGLN